MQFVRGIGENGRIASLVFQVRNRALQTTYLTTTLGEVKNQLELYSTIIFFLNLVILLFEKMLF
jgi:hypothetical protein